MCEREREREREREEREVSKQASKHIDIRFWLTSGDHR